MLCCGKGLDLFDMVGRSWAMLQSTLTISVHSPFNDLCP